MDEETIDATIDEMNKIKIKLLRAIVFREDIEFTPEQCDLLFKRVAERDQCFELLHEYRGAIDELLADRKWSRGRNNALAEEIKAKDAEIERLKVGYGVGASFSVREFSKETFEALTKIKKSKDEKERERCKVIRE